MIERDPWQGKIYILHFAQPIGHARHYTGYAPINLDRRLDDHAIGRGARLTQVAWERNIPWRCTWVRPGTRELERHLKRTAAACRLCPECRPIYNAQARARRQARKGGVHE